LEGKPVPIEKTKTFGCSIKWSEKRAAVKMEVEKMAKEPVTLEFANQGTIKKLVNNDTPKLRLINVWTAESDSCLNQLPELVTLNRMYRNSNFEAITICADSLTRKEKVLAALKEREVACSNYIFDKEGNDPLNSALDPQWPGEFPYTILVEPGGKIIQRQVGGIDSMRLKKIIALHPARQ